MIQRYIDRAPVLQWMSLNDWYNMTCIVRRSVAAFKAGDYITLDELKRRLEEEPHDPANS